MTHQRIVLEKNCRFCSIFQGEGGVLDVDAPWLVDDDYAALVSIGALVPGWTLLSPLSHAHNMQSAYSCTQFWDFAERAERVINRRYGSVAVFEHGPNAADSLTGCGTDHAHMHMVPLAFSLTAEALEFDTSLVWLPCAASEIQDRANGSEYLFVADQFSHARTQGMLCILQEPTSQFFRKVIASKQGMYEFFDYRRYPMLGIVAAARKSLLADSRVITPECFAQTVG